MLQRNDSGRGILVTVVVTEEQREAMAEEIAAMIRERCHVNWIHKKPRMGRNMYQEKVCTVEYDN